jgi:3-hydroxyacyl-CoA dehydrogenase
MKPAAECSCWKSKMRERETKHLGALDLAGALLEQIRSVVDQKWKAKTKFVVRNEIENGNRNRKNGEVPSTYDSTGEQEVAKIQIKIEATALKSKSRTKSAQHTHDPKLNFSLRTNKNTSDPRRSPPSLPLLIGTKI